jgi:hypothetical protein
MIVAGCLSFIAETPMTAMERGENIACSCNALLAPFSFLTTISSS